MKLKGKSIFDTATIVEINNSGIYCDDVMNVLCCGKLPECMEDGLRYYLFKREGFNGVIRFWVEGDNVYPMLKLDDVYFMELDQIYEEVKSEGIFSDEQIRLVD